MPTKRTSSKPSRSVRKSTPVAEMTDSESASEIPTSATGPTLSSIAQQLNLILILGFALFLFNLFLFWKVKQIEKTGPAVAGAAAGQNADSHLSDENLKKYADSVKLDTKKFETCLSTDATKDVIAADTQEAGTLGVQGTPGFFVNGRFLGGAFPFEMFKEIIDKELEGTATSECTDYSESLQTYCKDPANAAFKPEPQEINLGNAPVRGNADARVTLVEFSDFECPFCIRAVPIVDQIRKAYPNDVKIVYKHLPLTNIHPRAQKSAVAAACAQQQGKFWEYHDKLFEAGSQAQGGA